MKIKPLRQDTLNLTLKINIFYLQFYEACTLRDANHFHNSNNISLKKYFLENLKIYCFKLVLWVKLAKKTKFQCTVKTIDVDLHLKLTWGQRLPPPVKLHNPAICSYWNPTTMGISSLQVHLPATIETYLFVWWHLIPCLMQYLTIFDINVF